MTKSRTERLIELECDYAESTASLNRDELIELGRLRQEFETWEPEAPTPAPANPIGVTTSGTIVFPNANQSSPRKECICGCAWWGVGPPPPCPVHGRRGVWKVTCGP